MVLKWTCQEGPRLPYHQGKQLYILGTAMDNRKIVSISITKIFLREISQQVFNQLKYLKKRKNENDTLPCKIKTEMKELDKYLSQIH